MMETESEHPNTAEGSRRRSREQRGSGDPAAWSDGHADPRRGGRGAAGLLDTGSADRERGDGYRGREQGDGYRGPGRPDGYRGPEQTDSYRDQERSDTYRRPERPDNYRGPERGDGYLGRHSQPPAPADGRPPAGEPWPRGGPARAGTPRQNDPRPYRREDAPVARRTPTGWRVGDEEVSDLTSAMVLADLLAAELPAEGPPTPGGPAAAAAARHRDETEPPPDTRQLQETVAQLEHALTVRVRVEQAIGVLAERHRLRPRQAFEMLRSAARARGRRVLEVAGEVVDSASNPLLRIPEELAKPPAARRRGARMSRRPHASE
jgi:ANTAR domain